MAWTTPTVEVAFASDPLATSPTWTNISAYVVGDIAVKQGRSAEVDAPSAGTLTLTLDNRDRRFDPSHASGPYYGNLKQRKRIRVSVGASVLFTGWVQGWPQVIDVMGGNATVTITAVDALGMLALSPLGQTPYVAVQMRYAPDLYLRCDDDDPTTLLDSSSYDNHAKLVGAAGLAEMTDAVLPLGQGKAVANRPSYSTTPDFTHSIPPVYTGITQLRYQAVSLWVQVQRIDTVLPPYSAAILYGPQGMLIVSDSRPNTGFGSRLLLGFQGSGGGVYTDVSGTVLTWTLDSVSDDNWHHFFLVVDRTLNLARVYWDGLSLGDQSTTGGRGLFDTHYTATGYTLSRPGDRTHNTSPFPGGAFSNVAFMQSATSELWDKAAPDLWAAGHGWAGDNEAQRVSHVLDAIGWPDAFRTAGYSGSLQPTEDELPADALGYLASLIRRDGSTLLGMKDGTIKFRNRNALTAESRSIATQAAFGDDSGFTYRYSNIVPALDDEFVINVISAKRKGGERTFTVRDRTSIATYFHRLLDLGEVRSPSDEELMGFLGWLLRNYSTPSARLRSLTVNARVDATTLSKVVDLWIGDRISASFTPLAVGSATVYDQWIEGVEHHIDVSNLTWLTTYTTSPARVTITNPFIVGTSRLGPTGTNKLGH